MRKMRELRRDRETRSPGLHIWRGYWKEVVDMDEPERWRKNVKDLDRNYVLDLVETFFTDLDLR